MIKAHPAVREDDLRHQNSGDIRKQMMRDRKEAIRRLSRLDDWQLMKVLRSNGLYSHRTSDRDILAFIKKFRESLHSL